MFFALLPTNAPAQSPSTGYVQIANSIVYVTALDARGGTLATGTGFIVASTIESSTLITTTHLIKDAASIHVDVDSNVRDLVASVIAAGPYDMTLLRVGRGGLKPVRFAARAAQPGDPLALAGFFRNDEAGNDVRHVISPGTVSAVLRDGALFEFDNLSVRDGIGGGPVFEPSTGNVLGMVTTRTSDGVGGFAVAARPVITAFLNAQHVAVASATVATPPPPSPTPRATPPPPSPTPRATIPPPSPTPTPAAARTPAVAAVVAIPSRAGHPPPASESWLALDTLPGIFWLWTSAGYADGYQSIDVFLANDYTKTIWFFPEIRFTLDGKEEDFYFNQKRVFSIGAGSSGSYRLRFSAPRSVESLFLSLHDVRFGLDAGPVMFPR